MVAGDPAGMSGMRPVRDVLIGEAKKGDSIPARGTDRPDGRRSRRLRHDDHPFSLGSLTVPPAIRAVKPPEAVAHAALVGPSTSGQHKRRALSL